MVVLIQLPILIQFKDRCDNIIMDHEPWSMVQDHINRKVNMNKEKWNGLKPEFKPGGSRRQHILDKAVEYLADTRLMATQQKRHEFCTKYLEMSETEYLECLNKASNGGLEVWN